MENRPIVRFLCTGNSARGQMAEGLLRAKAEAAFEARSAGTNPAEAIHLIIERPEASLKDKSARRAS